MNPSYLYSQLKGIETTFFNEFNDYIKGNSFENLFHLEKVKSHICQYVLTYGPHKILLRSQIGIFTNYVNIRAYLVCENYGKNLELKELKALELIYNPAKGIHVMFLKSGPNVLLPQQFYQRIIKTLESELEKTEQEWLIE